MKNIVVLLFSALLFPVAAMAQSASDDLYFVPKKSKQEKSSVQTIGGKETSTVHVGDPTMRTVHIRGSKTNSRDVDVYNRRTDGNYLSEDDYYVDDLGNNQGDWVYGFEGSRDDYEYAQRLIRFRNPRYAVHISSPYYWDVVYGLNSWDWNVYTDGWYAYAFPTFSNRLWSSWRFGSLSFNWGWGYSGYPYSYYPYSSWYGPSWGWGGHYHHHHHWGYPSYYPYYGGYVRSRPGTRTYRRSYYPNSANNRGNVRTVRSNNRSTYTGGSTNRRNVDAIRSGSSHSSQRVTTGRRANTRVVSPTNNRVRVNREGTTGTTRTYTRPSSTRVNSSRTTGGAARTTRSTPNTNSTTRTRTFNRSTDSSTRNRTNSSSPTRSYTPSNSSRTYSPSRSTGGSSYRSTSGSSTRSSGGSSRSTGGGGSSRTTRR